MLKNNPSEDTASGRKKNDMESLNLYNFDDQKASRSPYILTSPRSLKACLLANIRPIELLHRSVADIAADLNLPENQVKHIYIDYEHERLRKLEVCKLIRKHMLLSGSRGNQKFTAGLCEDISNKELIEQKPSYINRGVTPEIHRLAKRSQSYSPCSTPITPIDQYNSIRCQTNRISHYGLSNSSSPSPVNNRKHYYKIRSKSAEAKHYKNMNHKKPNVEKNTTNAKRIGEKHQEPSKRCHITVNQVNDQQLCWQIDKVKQSENGCNKKIRFNQKTKQKSKSDRKSSTEKDERSVENHFIKNCEKIINHKPELENILDTGKYDVGTVIRKTTRERNTKYLTDKFNETIKDNGKEIEETRSKTDLNSVEAVRNHDIRILDAMATKKEFQQSQDNLTRKANFIWRTFEENPGKEIYSKCENKGNRNSKATKVDCCSCKENITFDNYFQQIRDRIKQLKENSLYKELHSEHVRQLARELQVGMEQWQDQVLLLQWQALQRARTNAKLHLENKRLKTRSENNERVLLHALRFRNVQDMERIKQQIIKKEIKEKDSRIEKLKMRREREIMDCRAQAQYTAELREQLRRTLTPETFDRKVNDVLIKSKFINRSLTSSPYTESHIRLG